MVCLSYLSLEVGQSDYEAAEMDLKTAENDMEAFKQYWDVVPSDHADSWNSAIKLSGHNYCTAIVAFNKAVISASISDAEKVTQMKTSLLKLYNLRADIHQIFDEGIDGKSTAWRGAVLNSIAIKALDSIGEIKKSASAFTRSKKYKI